MARRRQITVPIANQPGTLAGVTGAIGRAGVNVEAMTVFEGEVHVVVDDPEKAASALREAGYAVLEGEVLEVELDHTPGSLAKTTAGLAEAGINIDYAYSGPGDAPGRARMILAVSDPGRAEKVV